MTLTDLTLRPAQTNDLSILAEWLSNPDTNRWLFSQLRNKTNDERSLKPLLAGGKNRLYVGVSGDKPCSIVGLSNIDRTDRSAMLWWALGDKKLGGQGITTRTVVAGIRTAFEELELHSVCAIVMAPNHASLRVCEKAGLAPAGIYRQSLVLDGEFVDGHHFDAIKDSWSPT